MYIEKAEEVVYIDLLFLIFGIEISSQLLFLDDKYFFSKYRAKDFVRLVYHRASISLLVKVL